MSTISIRVVGRGPYGPVAMNIGDLEVVARINPAMDHRRYRCSVCGVHDSPNGCRHLQMAAIARDLACGTDQVTVHDTEE